MEVNGSDRLYSDSPAAMFEQSSLNGDREESSALKTEGRAWSDDGEAEAEEHGDVTHISHPDEKRSLRPKFDYKKPSQHHDHDDSDGELDSDAEDFHQLCLVNAATALKQYFFMRLEQTVVFLGGPADLLRGWKAQVVKRSSGLTLGLLEIFYFSNKGKKFRSRVEVACFLGLMPPIKSMRSMTKDQFYLNAIENRERHLISQQLAINDYRCDEIIFHNDVITLIQLKPDGATESNTADTEASPGKAEIEMKENSTTPAEKSHAIDFRTAKNLYFSFGNMVVLDWGRIIQDPAFHTNSQLYPLGFKCLRQEHDVTLDRVVDCLCEVDAVFEGGDGASVLYMLKHNLPIDPHRTLQPLFRLSVAWHIGDETSIGTAEEQDNVQIRVYEARSPQQAWQAAMLEGLGIKDESMLSVRPGMGGVKSQEEGGDGSADAEEDLGNFTDNASGEEDQDEEELALRMKIREQRRAYFRVLRAEQSAGMQAAVRPRLSLDTVDSFAEELILRLFEGMEGSINCRSYMYMDSREREGGKKNMQKCYTKAFTKAKNLDRVIRKNLYLSEQIQQLELKRRRVEVQESKKRAKIEDKETRSLVLTAQKSRNAKVKELEKNITMLKVAMAKTVKKRRDDAKLLAEILCDQEEIQRFARTTGQGACHAAGDGKMVVGDAEITASAARAEPRPEPLSSVVILNGRVVGQLLEVCEFLTTFSKDLQLDASAVPSVDKIMQAVKVFDPAYKSVRDYTRCLDRSFDKVTDFQPTEPTEADASDFLNKVGATLTSTLVKEFERLMGIDIAELQLGALRVPVNALTWREIARVVFMGTCCRELGVPEGDISALLKGRGYYTTPESTDRKVLKLARRRIKFAYNIRSELQESVFGFNSGMCVRLPAPANPFIEGCVMWSDLIATLRDVPDTCGWLIYEIIKAAALSVCIIDTTAAAKKLKKSLQATLGLTSFRMDNGAETKAAALRILEEEELLSQQWKLSNGRWKSSASSAASSAASDAGNGNGNGSSALEPVSHAEAAQLLRAKLQMVYDKTPYTVPTSTFDLWEKQMREALRHADFHKPPCATFATESDESERTESGRDLGSAMEDDGETETADAQSETKEDEAVPVVQCVVDDDTKQAEKLSIAMQRCYLVIRDLMMHPQANPFNWPVDFAVIPGYYKFVTQPLSLSEVRKFLVEGQYAGSIFRFYCDVLLVIENAMAYNPENSAVKISAQKMLIIFERLFFETVLCWDNPLPFQDCCHACRSPHPVSAGKSAVCDRCEGCYHLHCLDPPMQAPPRSEWYCQPCVEQKGVSSAHPYNCANVVHPADPESRGEVVGMEQIRQTVMFVVEFGNVREMWDGRKVRKYAIEPSNEEPQAPKSVFALMDDAEQKKGSLGFASSSSSSSLPDNASEKSDFQPIAPAESVYCMPSGYDYEDFDRVSGLARAYTGWGASHYLVPPLLMDQHNLAAQTRSKHDVTFPQYRDCVAALGYAAGGVLGDAMSAEEWGAVLNGLLHRVLDSAAVANGLVQLDDSVDDDLIAQIQDGVHSNTLPLDKIFGFIRGEGLVKLVKPAEVEPNPDAPRRGRKRRVDITQPGAAKRSASASSAVGEEEDAAEEDEDGEDEWDEDVDVSAPVAKKADEKEKRVAGAAGGAKKPGKRGKRAGQVNDADGEEEMASPVEKTKAAEPADETDSADEDDLEFFDADGNCLTSGVVDISTLSPAPRSQPAAPVLTQEVSTEYGVGCDMDIREANPDSPSANPEEPPVPEGPETEDDWNLRLLSRQKGREDALLTHTLVYDAITQLDVDGSKEQEEEVFKLVQPDDIGGTFFQTATNAIVKSCLGRPSESLVATEWTRGWESKMVSMQHYLDEYTFKDKEIVCPICGCEEGFLSSPMVWGQTSEEWEADVAADTAQDVLTEPEAPNDANAFPLAAGVSASTGIKGFRARYRVMKGLVWMPYDPAEAQVEEAECAAMKRTLKKGSLVMHECCANFVHFNRQMKQDKSRKMEDQRVIEAISGIGRAKCTPIGTDRDGSFYWIFRDSKCLYVSSSEHDTLREKSSISQPPGTSRWSVYRTDVDINAVCNWLDAKIATERILKKILGLLFPNAVIGEEVEPPKSAAPAIEAGNADVPVVAADAEAAKEDGGNPEGAQEITEAAMEVEPAPAARFAEVHPRPAGSLLLSGDIMEHSGDEGGSDDEAAHASSAKETATEMDCEEDEVVTAATVEEKEEAPTAGADASGTNNLSAKELLLQQQRKDNAIAAITSRPALSQRSPLLELYSPVEAPLPLVEKKSATRSASFLYRKGEHVLVDASPKNHILWDAHVLEMKAHRMSSLEVSDSEVAQINMYKLRFDRWGSAYDGWYEESQMLSNVAMVTALGLPKITARAVAQESKISFIRENVWTPPEILKSLSAFQFLKEPQRACGTSPPLNYSDCQSAIGQLRTAMLMIEAALPVGSVDDSDDRWGEDFAVPWREAVAVAGDATALMQCQLMLEYGIRTSWLKPAGLKMFSCLPSRVQCVRNATCGLVAIRVWVLDATIKYDQVKKDEKVPSGKGRPPKHPLSGAAASSAAGKPAPAAAKKAKKWY